MEETHSLPDGDALSLLPRLKQSDDTVPIIVLAAHASIDLAVAAVKLGADHFLTKPVELPALLVVLQRSLENERSRRSQMAARKRTRSAFCSPVWARMARQDCSRCVGPASTIAQDEASSVVFGMPKEAIALGGAESVLGLRHVPAAIRRWSVQQTWTRSGDIGGFSLGAE